MTRPTRVLHIPTDTGVGGTERRLADFIKASNKKQFEHRVLALKALGDIGEELTRAGFSVASLEVTRITAISGVPELIKAIKQYRPDIVQTYLFGGNTAGRLAARITRVPIIISGYASTDPWMRPHHVVADSVTARLASAHLANCEAVADAVARRCGIPRASIETIHTGRPIPERFARHRERADGTVRGIAVGRLHRSKGYDVLIRALSRADSRIVITVAGTDTHHNRSARSLREQLESLARRVGVGDRIVFLGQRADVSELLAEADFHVLPSRWEGLPGSLIEAMASGLPSVATAVGGVPEALIDGETGFLAEPEDPDDLAACLDRIISSDRAILGGNARQRAIEHFSIATMTQRWENFYRREVRLAHTEGPGL